MSDEMIIGNRRRFGVISLTSAVGFFLAIAPVLDPYIIVEIGSGITIKVNDIFMILLGILCFSKSIHLERKTDFLIFWLIGLGMISVLGNIGSNTVISNSFKNIFVWMIYAIFLAYIWKRPCRESFFKWLEIIALIAACIVIIQFVFGYLGISMWDGKIPGLQLSKYDGWAGYIDRNTGDIRPNGIFQEASYFGIYVSVAYAQTLKEERIIRSIIYAIAMLITTSMVSIVALVAITVIILVERKKIDLSSKMTRRIIAIIIIAIVAMVYLSSRNEAIGDSISYIRKRIVNFNSDLNGARMSSTKYRILGQISLFDKYTFWQKVFGVGVAQYSTLFFVKPYSNIWVTTILNSGILGLIFLIICVVLMFKRVQRENIVYTIVFLLVISADYQWFSWYFFYLITACIVEDYDKINQSVRKR